MKKQLTDAEKFQKEDLQTTIIMYVAFCLLTGVLTALFILA